MIIGASKAEALAKAGRPAKKIGVKNSARTSRTMRASEA
jgi:hypothetical protein